MKLAVGMTVTNRPQYLKPVLDSWAKVRGLHDVRFEFHCEPTITLDENVQLINDFIFDSAADGAVIVNPEVFGISRNPFTTMGSLFLKHDYVILAEDDLVVSNDILEFHRWAAETYVDDQDLLCVCSFTHDEIDPAAAVRDSGFGPWVWGTWRDRWNRTIGATWDVNQEHHAPGRPGDEVGWDWHLNTRVMPTLDVHVLRPLASRSNSIGIYGAHSTPQWHVTAAQFKADREPVEFFEKTG